MDKIEKIRQEIERLKSQFVRGASAAQVCMETSCKEEAYNEVLSFIDSLQDEPNVIDAIQYEAQKIIQRYGDSDSMPYVEFVERLASGCEILKDEPKNPIDVLSEKCQMDETPAPENVEPIDTSDLVFSGDSIVAHKVETISYPPRMIDALRFKKRKMEIKMWKTLSEEERLEYIRLHKEIKKEAESDDLEKAEEEYTDGINWAKENYITPYIRLSFKAGANWLAEQRDKLNVVNPIRLDEDTLKHIQELAYESGKADMKEEFEKNRLDACDKITKEEYDLETALVDKYIKKYKRLPMFADAIKFGMELQKEQDHDACLSCEKSRDVVFHKGEKHAIEQMKKEAVEGTVCKQRDSTKATWIELAPNSLSAFDDCELVKCIILKDE